MNFLAHAYLSFNDPDILVGNMISDFVKGRDQYNYADAIHKGIVLHRRIDEFTDHHPATAEAKSFFRPHYRLYSGAITDVIYDHFLANDAIEFSGNELFDFTQQVYAMLESHPAELPPRFITMMPYMKAENWLYHYKEKKGIHSSLKGLVRRAAYLSDHDKAIELFGTHYDSLKTCYAAFFPDVKEFTKDQLQRLNR